MPILRNDIDQVFDGSGALLSATPIVRDITVEVNGEALRTKAQQALAANATFLALATPTAAQIAAQTRLLTRETNALIRLLLNSLTDISDT